MNDFNYKKFSNAHLIWKSNLEHLIEDGLKEDLDLDSISSCHNCDLGKWIDNSTFDKNDEDFIFLNDYHEKFHLTSGKIIQSYKKEDLSIIKETLLKELNHISMHVMISLQKINLKINGLQY